MDIKVIIYIVIGILYFLYTVGKKAQEKQNSAAPPPPDVPKQKPVSAPDFRREAEQNATKRRLEQKYREAQRQKPAKVQSSRPELIQELRAASVAELAPNKESELSKSAASTYSMDIYKQDKEEEKGFEFNAREAFIGSIIFDRKYQ